MTRPAHVTAMVLLVLCFSACSAPPVIEQQSIKFNVITHSQTSGFTFQKLIQIRNAEDFQDLWTIHSQPTGAAMPKIDFEKDMVLAVFYGQTQTGGHDIYIHDIEEQDTEIIVNIRTVEPAPNSMRTMMISQPNMIVSIPKTDKPIRFVHQQAK